jgi:hypothetical protein
MNENILTIILCIVASLLAVILCNYNKCKYRFKYCCQKKSKSITIDEMKIIIDDMDEFENDKNSDEIELL